MHGVIWLPLNWIFSIVPPIDSTRDFSVSSRRSVSSIVSKLNFTYKHHNNKTRVLIITSKLSNKEKEKRNKGSSYVPEVCA